MRKTLLWGGLTCLLGSSLLTSPVQADSGAVSVHIASFPVKVNGQLIDQTRSRFPFIVFKDITYAPLNWDTLQELELDAEWSPSDGLTVYRTCCTSPYWKQKALEKSPYSQAAVSPQSTKSAYKAQISKYPITVWGERIANEKEPFPFLEFRGVTYLPLTWTYAHTRLMMDLQWSSAEGLAIWSGQDQVMAEIMDDDEDALYIRAGHSVDAPGTIMKVAKSLQGPAVWLDDKTAQSLEDKRSDDAKGIAGAAIHIERQGASLSYKGYPLGQLLDEELGQLGDTTLRIEGTLYPIDGRRQLIAVYSYFPIAVIGPAPGSRYRLFAIVDGQSQEITDYPFLPQFVHLNADGSVWIASERKQARNYYLSGSGRLAVMDPDGSIRLANRLLNEQDISPLGLTSSTNSPVDEAGNMLIRLYGKHYEESSTGAIDPSTGWNPLFSSAADRKKDGIYEVDTNFHLRRLSGAPDDQDELYLYKDKQGDIFTINRFSNTITNWTQARSRTWIDRELLIRP